MHYRTMVLLAAFAVSCGAGRFGHPDEHDLYFHNDATESIFSLWYQVDGGEKRPLRSDQQIGQAKTRGGRQIAQKERVTVAMLSP